MLGTQHPLQPQTPVCIARPYGMSVRFRLTKEGMHLRLPLGLMSVTARFAQLLRCGGLPHLVTPLLSWQGTMKGLTAEG